MKTVVLVIQEEYIQVFFLQSTVFTLFLTNDWAVGQGVKRSLMVLNTRIMKQAIGVRKTSLGCLLLTFHVRLGFVSLLACGGLCLLALAPGGGPLLGCFLFQHGPVKRVVILVVQSPVNTQIHTHTNTQTVNINQLI